MSDDLISRQAALKICRKYWHPTFNPIMEEIEKLPSAQSERLTDDDFETIRIHLSAFKEDLCNQRRWKEAEDYERLISRFISFASAQPEVKRCKDCKYNPRNPRSYYDNDEIYSYAMCGHLNGGEDGFCSNYKPFGEREES